MRFDDLQPGDLFQSPGTGSNYVKVDTNTDLAEFGSRWMAVEVGTGVVTLIGPDTEVEPLMRRC